MKLLLTKTNLLKTVAILIPVSILGFNSAAYAGNRIASIALKSDTRDKAGKLCAMGPTGHPYAPCWQIVKYSIQTADKGPEGTYISGVENDFRLAAIMPPKTQKVTYSFSLQSTLDYQECTLSVVFNPNVRDTSGNLTPNSLTASVKGSSHCKLGSAYMHEGYPKYKFKLE